MEMDWRLWIVVAVCIGFLITGVLPLVFKKIVSCIYTIKYATYFNQKFAYDQILQKLNSGLTMGQIMKQIQEELQNGRKS